MPLYQYACEACGAEWEEFFPIGHGPEQCPMCWSGRLHRVYTPPVAKLEKESPARYQEWYHSAEVQEGLRTGKYRHIRKDEDVNHL